MGKLDLPGVEGQRFFKKVFPLVAGDDPQVGKLGDEAESLQGEPAALLKRKEPSHVP